MSDILNWLLARLAEKTTWVGLAGVVATTGVGVFGDQAFKEQFAVLGTALISLIVMILKENGSD